MLRKIIQKGDPILEKKCHAVTRFDEKLHLLLDDMQETLMKSGGVGLAAPPGGDLSPGRGCDERGRGDHRAGQPGDHQLLR